MSVWGGLGAASMAMVGLSDLSDLLACKSTPIFIFRVLGFFLFLSLGRCSGSAQGGAPNSEGFDNVWQQLDQEISQVCQVQLLCQPMNSAADRQKSTGREKCCAEQLRKTQHRGADAGGEGTTGTHQENKGT